MSRHEESPFHHVEMWTGVYFKRVALADLGLKLYCGHYGSPCPSATSESTALLRIIDSGGIHKIPIYACFCSRGEKKSLANQLLLMKLFPATDNIPETAATLQALEDFDMHNVCGKESIWDYYGAVRRKTNSVKPHLVPVGRRVLQRSGLY